jgi:hypothetical protein
MSISVILFQVANKFYFSDSLFINCNFLGTQVVVFMPAVEMTELEKKKRTSDRPDCDYVTDPCGGCDCNSSDVECGDCDCSRD